MQDFSIAPRTIPSTIYFERYEIRIPEYAICYLVNGDDSGLYIDEIKEIDDFMHQFDGHYIISLDEKEPYFCSNPAFGLPCNVFDVTVLLQK